MTTAEFLKALTARSVELTVTPHGKVKVASAGELSSSEYAEIAARKAEILSILVQPTPEPCPTCGASLIVSETDGYRSRECPVAPIHFFEAIHKRPGKPMGLFTDYVSDGTCARCGAHTETFNGVCEDCHAREASRQEDAA